MRGGDVREVHLAGQDLLDDRQVRADLTQGPDQLETSQRLAVIQAVSGSTATTGRQQTLVGVPADGPDRNGRTPGQFPGREVPGHITAHGTQPGPLRNGTVNSAYVTAQSIALAAPVESEIP